MGAEELVLKAELAKRLQAERARLNLTPEEIAEKTGVHRSTLFNYLSGTRVPDAIFLSRLRSTTGADLIYLITGERDLAAATNPGPESRHALAHTRGGEGRVTGRALLPAVGTSSVRPLVLSLDIPGAGRRREYEVIPKLMGPAHAGRQEGSTDESTEIDLAGDMAWARDWLAEQLGHTSGQLAHVTVVGDSMSPTLLDGDVIVIDTAVREVTVDDIYVIRMLGQRLVKRLQRKRDGSLIIISDNDAYERETVPRGNVGEVQVIGRKVWPRTR